MTTIEIVGAAVMILISILLIVLTAIQDSKSDGISALGGGGFATGENDRSSGAKLVKATRLLTIAFFVIAVAVCIIYSYVAK